MFCYKYLLNQAEVILVELYDDAAFGMHSARIARDAPSNARECAEVSSLPKLNVGDERIDLTKALPSINGFAANDRFIYPTIKQSGFKGA